MNGVRADGEFRPLDSGDPRAVAGYRLAARLGSGGMGTVYLSYTPGGHPIALKTIRPELSEDPEFRRRFRQEVRAAQRVQGLYTAPVIDHDTEGARPWLATAYVAGPSLASAVAEHGPLPLPSVLLLLAGMAEALSMIHGAGIVHRDLKPSNVLLAADGPRVIDFGIARAADATALTGTGVSIGTPAFMSPEQAAGRPVTPASDVFALGQVAVFAARGQGAYGEGPSHAVLYRIVHEEPDLAGMPAELAFVARCLAKDPAERPTPAEVVAWCQEASPAPLRQSGSWLPKALTAQITQRVSASAALAAAPTVAPAAPPPTRPLPGPGTPAPTARLPHPGPALATPAQPPRAPGYRHPAPPQPYPPYVQPYGWQPPKPKRSVGRKIAIGAAVGVALLWGAGCVSVLSHLGDSTDDNSSRTPAGASGQHRPDPRPVSFKGINIPRGYWVRFADSPPKPMDEQNTSNASFGKDADFYYDDDPDYSEDQTPVVGTAGDKVVLLNNAEHGSLATCRRVTRYAENIHLSQLSKGSQICVHTVSGHIGLVTYRGAAGRGSPSDYITVDLTVWRNAEPASDDEQ
ncbi:serine/threonine protein kinase [Streptomyces sp. TR1341]|uniref:protein kinase domain-containing protein n=1 Tax=Streptomyces sp. TR1341 TaxID=2601266 RepID=UPI00138AB074|nr:serine/threonine protein kinase [Streptomyces sp. TR1341]